MEWITFQGKKVSTETVDHQHLSNAIWFLNIFWPPWETILKTIEELQQALRDRFNGQILPYRPHVDFEDEIEELKNRGYLSDLNEAGVATITYKGVVIGEVRKFPFKIPPDEQL